MWRGVVNFYIDPSWNAVKQRLQESVLQILDLASSFVRVEQVSPSPLLSLMSSSFPFCTVKAGMNRLLPSFMVM
jgi:hypothetical protein